jgi:hypothetical protein
MKRLSLVTVFAVAFAAFPVTGTAQTYLVVVSGLGGEARYRMAFQEWGSTLVATARDRFAIPAERIVYLTESPELDSAASAKSTKVNIEASLDRLAMEVEPDALVVIVLIGHGSAVAGASRINLPGPDMTAEDFAALLARFPSQQIVFANLSSASGEFVSVLSGERRVIVTATKSGLERHESIFAGHFVDAFAAEGADTDKNERVSLLEAFEYARLEVGRVYESDNRLLTEHALLDDNGDGEGSAEPSPDSADGSMAAQIFLESATSRVADTVADPELAALYETRRDLEGAVAALRARRSQMSVEEYEQELERILLELARTNRQIREREGGSPQ